MPRELRAPNYALLLRQLTGTQRAARYLSPLVGRIGSDTGNWTANGDNRPKPEVRITKLRGAKPPFT